MEPLDISFVSLLLLLSFLSHSWVTPWTRVVERLEWTLHLCTGVLRGRKRDYPRRPRTPGYSQQGGSLRTSDLVGGPSRLGVVSPCIVPFCDDGPLRRSVGLFSGVCPEPWKTRFIGRWLFRSFRCRKRSRGSVPRSPGFMGLRRFIVRLHKTPFSIINNVF